MQCQVAFATCKCPPVSVLPVKRGLSFRREGHAELDIQCSASCTVDVQEADQADRGVVLDPPPTAMPQGPCSRRRRGRCGSAPRCAGCGRRRRRGGGAVRVGRPVRRERSVVLDQLALDGMRRVVRRLESGSVGRVERSKGLQRRWCRSRSARAGGVAAPGYRRGRPRPGKDGSGPRPRTSMVCGDRAQGDLRLSHPGATRQPECLAQLDKFIACLVLIVS